MNQPSRISIEITAAVLQAAMTKVQELAQILEPFLQSLKAEERHDLPKMGDKTIAFVEKVVEYVGTTPDFIPSYMDVNEFKKDFAAVQSLRPLLGVLQQLTSNVDDTVMLAGSEAYVSSLLYYANATAADKRGVANAKPVYADLAKRYPGRSAKGATPSAG